MILTPIKTRVFREGESLLEFIKDYDEFIKERTILVVTSKIIALAENRTAVIEDASTKDMLIREESDLVIPTKHVSLTIKDGMMMAEAGIDESNANGKLILLPKDSFRSARKLRTLLRNKFRIKNLGILITDSRTVPLRAGVTGVALGYSGFKGIRDYRGQSDIFGRKFKFSRTNVADCLSSAAVLVMGEGREQCPLALISDVSVEFCDRTYSEELKIDLHDDMYGPLFLNLNR